MAYRTKKYEQLSKEKGVLMMCEIVSASIRGSSDTYWLDVQDYVECLREVLENWKPSPNWSEDPVLRHCVTFDENVKGLVQAAVNMYDARVKEEVEAK
jgi:hypothetical protein